MKKITKKELKRLEQKKLQKDDREWSKKIREVYPECIICGSKVRLNAHHIIPREIKKTRHELFNGVSLCPKHHKWGINSAHRNPLWFLLKLHEFSASKLEKCIDSLNHEETGEDNNGQSS